MLLLDIYTVYEWDASLVREVAGQGLGPCQAKTQLRPGTVFPMVGFIRRAPKNALRQEFF